MERTGGGQGFADVLFLNHSALQYNEQHVNLDRAVWAAYGWPGPAETDPSARSGQVETILAWLLALNLERASGSTVS
jgi:hypothetical protein